MEDRVMASSAVLMAASHYLFKECSESFNVYMQCREDNKMNDPAVTCQDHAHQSLECARQAFVKLKESDPETRTLFRRMWRCLDNNDQNVIYCREEEAALDAVLKVKTLWRGRGPSDGYKAPEESNIEADRWPFQWHVWRMKNHKPQ